MLPERPWEPWRRRPVRSSTKTKLEKCGPWSSLQDAVQPPPDARVVAQPP